MSSEVRHMTKNDEYDSTQTLVIVWTDFHILPVTVGSHNFLKGVYLKQKYMVSYPKYYFNHFI